MRLSVVARKIKVMQKRHRFLETRLEALHAEMCVLRDRMLEEGVDELSHEHMKWLKEQIAFEATTALDGLDHFWRSRLRSLGELLGGSK